ncbi:MAG: helix-turn-helix domain-containing protein [Gammaproteobacteria bacterium]|nr:helix-turn-helix domain-containing protein [Gammaproteobacteria bacterium]MBU1725648.1 helix-turn-helix domain-containing protein [Gammaproteobacteria bacterium]MBU2004000.1 helix-turn-helix domain-containing protein [Gammaproteobacteria bacterium]
MPTTLTIGKLGQASGVNIETIRYYERNGLLPSPTRSSSGYRHYREDDVKRLRFIRRGRELGFGLEEIRSLLQLTDQPQQPCDTADQLVQKHMAEVDARIRDLQAIRAALGQLAGCQSQTAEHCRLLEALEERDCCIKSGHVPD